MSVELKCRLEGLYKLDVFDAATHERTRGTPWFGNLITDSGKDLIAQQSYLTICQCGTGTATPSNSDTTMAAFVASTGTILSQVQANNVSPAYAKITTVYQFGVGVAAGNIAEVGISYTTSSSGPLFSRALVLDGGGSPTTITVLSTEYLQVTYQLRLYVPTIDVTGSVTINSISYTTTWRAAKSGNWTAGAPGTNGIAGSANNTGSDWTGTIGAITAQPGGSAVLNGYPVTNLATYVGGHYYQDLVLSHPINAGGTIQSFWFFCILGQWQFQISPSLVLLNTQQLTMTVRISWDRGSEPP